jgi:hypothetical protein
MDNANKTTALLPVGSNVRVQFGTGHFNGRFYRAGWRVGTITGHTTIGEARRPGGWATYCVTMRDGNVMTHCSPDCVRAR